MAEQARTPLILAMTTFVVAFALAPITTAEAANAMYRIVSGKQNQLCIDATKILHEMPKQLFASDGGWRIWFDEGTNWESKTTFLRRPDDTQVPYDYSYANFDIDNNGEEELIIWNVSMIRSVDMDFWFVFLQSQSTLVLGPELPVSQLDVPQLSGSSGSAANFVPTEFARWSRNGLNYIVMREYGFPGQNNVPSSFLVTKYEGHVVKRGGGSKAEVKVLCEIK